MAKKRRALETEDIVFAEENDSEESVREFVGKPKISKEDDVDALGQQEAIAMLAGLEQIEENLYASMEYDEDAEQLHPAEIAAAHQANQKLTQVGGSDEQILKDLRKLVFTVPLLHRQDVHNHFLQIDQVVFPTVYAILECSQVFLNDVIQIITKVAAGNTYGKNIYEKEDNHVSKESEAKSTYRNHEIKFLENAYDLLRYHAHVSSGVAPQTTVKAAMERCAFIRGVYEDILKNFIDCTRGYDLLHWNAIKAKINNDTDEYEKTIHLISLMDKKYKLSKNAFYIVREAQRVYQRYTELRSFIITPYLRTVYSEAKNIAKNAHQMLDNFQNGSIGLMRAVSCYSTKRQASFSSVAKCWIKQMMLLTIKENANFVKLPVSTWQTFTHLEKIRAKVGVTDDNYDLIAKAAGMPVEKVKNIYRTVKISQVYSLNKTYDSDERLTLEDIMAETDNLGGPEDQYSVMLREYCASASLSSDEITVIALRHGMPDVIAEKETCQAEVFKEALTQCLAKLGYGFEVA